MSFLSDIIAAKQREVRNMPDIPIVRRQPKSGFIDPVLLRKPFLIAEVKPRSPVAGPLIGAEKIPGLVDLYNAHADAISVLCDSACFGGGYDLLSSVRAMTDKPLLAKEFIIHERQIAKAAACGADAVLLIAAILDDETLVRLCRAAIDAGLDVVLEIHDGTEIEKMKNCMDRLSADQRLHVLAGINNRDLRTLKIDLRTTGVLAPQIRREMPGLRGIVCESGVGSREDIQRLADNADGFLIGSAILSATDPAAFLSSLFPR